jgi:hypothetical protein
MKQQTAVDWLIGKLQTQDGTYRGFCNIAITHQKIINQAKEMQKQQMIEFAENSLDYLLDNREDLILLTTQDRIEHFYNETYGGNK